MSLQDFLVYLSTGGAVVVLSWLWEFFGWFPKFNAQQKKLTLFGLSSALGIGAWALATFVPPDIISQAAPVFAILGTGFYALFLGQVFHSSNKQAK